MDIVSSLRVVWFVGFFPTMIALYKLTDEPLTGWYRPGALKRLGIGILSLIWPAVALLFAAHWYQRRRGAARTYFSVMIDELKRPY